MDITPFLKLMVDKHASDLFFSVGAPVNIKIKGVVSPLTDTLLQPGSVRELACSIMDEKQIFQFEEELESNLAVSISGLGRFRVNIYQQRGEVAMVVRYIQAEVPDLETLHLPAVLKELVMEQRGLILVVGSTGSGKSTTLASMIDYRSQSTTGHILSIEDPIEYLHRHNKSVVDQREVGLDTRSYANALKNAMREAPDVILIGEIRDRETMQHAISYAETGHLCLSTLHANNANQTLDRIINFFPDGAQHQLFMDLSLNLRAVISQRLVKTIDGGLYPAVETLLGTLYISELIQRGEIGQIRDAMEQSTDPAMQTLDQALYELYIQKIISEDEALRNADSRTNLALRIRLGRHAGLGATSNIALLEEN